MGNPAQDFPAAFSNVKNLVGPGSSLQFLGSARLEDDLSLRDFRCDPYCRILLHYKKDSNKLKNELSEALFYTMN